MDTQKPSKLTDKSEVHDLKEILDEIQEKKTTMMLPVRRVNER